MRTFKETKAEVIPLRDSLSSFDFSKLPRPFRVNEFSICHEPSDYAELLIAQLNDNKRWNTLTYQSWVDQAIEFVCSLKKNTGI
jgi:hypothetical protein